MIKALPIGLEDYIQATNTYYVDKTTIIKDIIDYFVGKSVLITRPRRFGKSLMLSMLDYFFTNKGDFAKYFENKEIFTLGQTYKDLLNKFPVIHLNMKNVYADSEETLISNTIDLISNLYAQFDELLYSDKLTDFEKEEFDNVLKKKSDNRKDYVFSILRLSEFLYKHYEKKVIILLDEYDTPLEISFQKKFYDKVIEFYSKFYSSFLKGNNYLYFSIITGVLEIAKESIFSDLNNLNVFDVTEDTFIEYFGFTEGDVKKIFKDFDCNFDFEQVKKWYGGYGNKRVEIFNPWSILNLISKERFLPYWVNSGSNETINNLISEFDGSLILLNRLIQNKNELFSYTNTTSYKDIKHDFKTLCSYLVQSGYLVAEYSGYEDKFILRVPNYEISKLFTEEIIARNIPDKNLSTANVLKEALISGDTNKITRALEEHILQSYSYYDLKSEKEYQIMLVAIFATLFFSHIVKSEVNNSNGRCDIMVKPKENNDVGMVIELKKYKGRLSESRLSALSKKAIEQIKDLRYYTELEQYGVKKILLYGFAFDDHKEKITFEEIESKK